MKYFDNHTLHIKKEWAYCTAPNYTTLKNSTPQQSQPIEIYFVIILLSEKFGKSGISYYKIWYNGQKIFSYIFKGILAIPASIIYVSVTRNLIWSHTYKIPYKKLDFWLVMNSEFFF